MPQVQANAVVRQLAILRLILEWRHCTDIMTHGRWYTGFFDRNSIAYFAIPSRLSAKKMFDKYCILISYGAAKVKLVECISVACVRPRTSKGTAEMLLNSSPGLLNQRWRNEKKCRKVSLRSCLHVCGSWPLETLEMESS
jgi:hypothetical protein